VVSVIVEADGAEAALDARRTRAQEPATRDGQSFNHFLPPGELSTFLPLALASNHRRGED